VVRLGEAATREGQDVERQTTKRDWHHDEGWGDDHDGTLQCAEAKAYRHHAL
jgi:hypothetical protein